ncbi:predicted protein [Nematostella vectensis]|uniref:Retrotransposon gag domain-containing protein n=1 Tax=Nematostella vectensis TaxID=45351 RepID=A7S4I1_NEMVE|nr:predicted protein [Nematostella vectensis]|eukprot:XP_001633480.1 predicted protein [Nematostella vectensis]
MEESMEEEIERRTPDRQSVQKILKILKPYVTPVFHESTTREVHSTYGPGPRTTRKSEEEEMKEANRQVKQQNSLAALETTVEESGDLLGLRAGMKPPTFSGDGIEDVNDFITRFQRMTEFYRWDDERKLRALPLYLTGNASVRFNSHPRAALNTWDAALTQLKNHFDSGASQWLLRQQLDQRVQEKFEPLAQYIADIRRLCQRLKLPKSEWLHQFVRGLRGPLKEYVVLQSPADFETAETQARLRDAVSGPPTDLATVSDELTKRVINGVTGALAKTIPSSNPSKIAAYEPTPDPSRPSHRPGADNLTRDDIRQIIQQELRKELRRSNPPNQNYDRNRRTYTGIPISSKCNTIHVAPGIPLDESVFPNNDSPDTRDQTVESFEINNNDFSSQENAQSHPNLDNNDRFTPVRRTFFSDKVIQVDERPPRKCFPPTEVMFNFEEGTTPQVLAEGHGICDETFHDNHQSILDMDFGMDNSILQQPMSPSLDETDDNLPEINTIINTSDFNFDNQNNGTDVTVNVPFLTTDDLMLHGQIFGHNIDLLVDTGAAISCISSSTWRRLNTTNNLQLRDFSSAALQTVDGHSLTILDIFTADLSLGNRVFTLDLLVIKNLTYDAILGKDFLSTTRR